jgi:hypothetical protein
MIRSQSSVGIDRPAEVVFQFVADGTNNVKWRAGVIEISKVGGEGVGTVYRQILQGPRGRHIAAYYRVTDFEPPSLLRFQVIAGPLRPKGTFDVRADGATRSTLTFSLEVKPKGIMKLMSPMITRQVRSEVEAIAQLKQVLESA